MSDDGGCGGGDSGGGGYDSSCGAPDSSYHHDSSHHDSSHYDPSPCYPSRNSEDCHSTVQGIFNDDAGNISSNTPRWENESNNTPPWKSKGKYSMNSQTKKAEVQRDDCCCTLIWSELSIIS
jgi:hypothetical protein